MPVSAEVSVVSAIAGSGRRSSREAADELGGDVLGVGGAAAVAEEQDFPSGAQRRHQ